MEQQKDDLYEFMLAKKQKKERTNKLIYRWFGAILFLILLITALSGAEYISSVLFLIGLLFCIPFTFKALFGWLGHGLSGTIKVVIALFLLFVGAALIKSDLQPETKAEVLTLDSTTEVTNVIEPVKEYTPWTYDENLDEMTDKKSYFAQTTSTNVLEFEFPYQGGSNFTLTIRKKPGETDCYIQVSKGQFLGDFSGDRTLRLRFDDANPVNYSYSMASDGSSDLVFINNVQGFISRLKKSKRLKVEAEFYQEGRQIMEFDVSNLEWKY